MASTLNALPTSPGPPISRTVNVDPHLQPTRRLPPPYDPKWISTSQAEDVESFRKARQEAIEAELKEKRIVKGLDDDDLNALLRMFDKHVQNVHICPPYKQADIQPGLDFQASPEEEFTIDKLRSNLERFYSTVVVGLLRCVMEIQRIRRWEEGGSRTVVALFAYATAWYLDLIISSLLFFLGSLILSPSIRKYCFDPPLYYESRVESKSQTIAGSEDQASDWASNMLDLMTSLAKPGGSTGSGEKMEQSVTEEVNGVVMENMKKKEGTHNLQGKSDKEKAIELYARPTMKIIGGLADKWERIANCLNPTPPFLLTPHRKRVFLLLIAPLLVISTFVSERMVSRFCGIAFGFIIFGKPIIDRTIDELDRRYPHWFERLIVEHNILSEVPTNMQLVLRLLRDAEHKRDPIPPPERKSDKPQLAQEEENTKEDQSDDSNNQDGSMGKMKTFMSKTEDKMSNGLRSKIRRGWDKAGWIKEEGFAFIAGHKTPNYESIAKNAFNKLNISHETQPARAILQRLPSGSKENLPDTPSRFYVNHVKHGPGHLIIYPPTMPKTPSSQHIPARIEFTTIRRVPASRNVAIEPTPDSDSGSGLETGGKKGHLTISINDIISLKKEGMSWPRRAITSWALDTDGAGGTGLEIKIARRGHLPPPTTTTITANGSDDGKIPSTVEGMEETIKLKSIVRRDELFSRLLSIGEQRWELL